MTIEQRKEIFAKEVWTILDIAIVFEYDNLSPTGSYNAAAAKMREIKRKGFDRLHIEGRLHIQDYFDCYKLPPYRYVTYLSNQLLDNKDEKD
ncbi:MAG: hypothetical protein K2M47_01025 [Clostridiales bacterium]|nr:hypothetical protein [Clostridiales bacterium]